MQDAELAQRAATGDRAAWAALYDRYADRLHDYCWSVLRDRHEAEEATHDAFVTASRKIGQLRDPALLRAWLYAQCRTQALSRSTPRWRHWLGKGPSERPSERPGAGPGAGPAGVSPPAVEAERSGHEVEQLRALAWTAAGGLAARDRAVLELHLRHGLEGTELAEALGTHPHHATVLLTRLRGRVERSLGILLAGRTGRRECTELDTMLGAGDRALAPLPRRRVARHLDTCPTCGERRGQTPSPLGLLSGVPLLPAPDHLRERVLADLVPTGDGVLTSASDGAGSGRSRPVAVLRRSLREGQTGLVAGAAALTVLAIVGAALISVGRKGEPTNLGITGLSTSTAEQTTSAAESATSASASTTEAPSSTTATSSSTPPAAVDVVTGVVDFGTSATDALLRFRNTGGRPLPWSVSSNNRAVTMEPFNGTLAAGQTTAISIRLNRGGIPEGDFAAQLRLVAAGNTTVPVTAVENRAPTITEIGSTTPWLVASATSTCDRAAVSALVADDSPVTVTVSWQQGSGPTVEAPAAGSAGRYSASVGPITAPTGNVRWWVTATDSRGNTSRSPDQGIEVRADPSACP